MKEIVINSKKYGCHAVMVDDEDYELVSSKAWYLKRSANTYYAVTNEYINGLHKHPKMHRVIFGIDDPSVFVDHKDRNGLNNQRDNLRITDYSKNGANRQATKSSSKYLGVHWEKRDKVWAAQTRINGKKKRIGSFKSEDDAAIAYNEKALEVFGEFANLNRVNNDL